MSTINFPNPPTSPWTDANGQVWAYVVAKNRWEKQGLNLTTTSAVADAIQSASSKSEPTDLDDFAILDDADSGKLKRLGFSGLWEWIKAKLNALTVIEGPKEFTGGVQAFGQDASSADTLLTRKLAEDLFFWTPQFRIHGAPTTGVVAYGGGVTGIAGLSCQISLGVTTNGAARIALSSNWQSVGFSGAPTFWNTPFKLRIPFSSIQSDVNSVMRVWTGSSLSVGLPFSKQDPVPIGMATIGFEFRPNPTTLAQHQIRLIARDGFSRASANYTFVAASPVVTGATNATTLSSVALIQAELTAGRVVRAVSYYHANVGYASSIIPDDTIVLSTSGYTITLSNNAVQAGSYGLRFVFEAEIGTLGVSDWYNVGSSAGLSRQYDVIVENSGTGIANLYAQSWDGQGDSAVSHSRTPIATLTTGVPTNSRSLLVNSSAVEMHVITDGINAPTNTTSNHVVVFNTYTFAGL